MATRKLTNSTVATEWSDEVRPNDVQKPMASAKEFNATFKWENETGLPVLTADLVGDTIRNNVVLPHGENKPGTVQWQIDAGWSQDVTDGIITYGFANMKHSVGLNNNPSFGEGAGYTSFSAAQMTAARVAINNWDELIVAKFVEVKQGPGASDFGRQTTDIMLANTTTGPAQAWAYYPGYEHQYSRVAGDVWINNLQSSNNQFLPGQYGLHTLNHELGHAIGLSHPGTYNFSDDNDGDGKPDPITYDGDAQYFQDSAQYTIMSYFDSFETGAQNIDWNVMRFVYPSTPMVDDVQVIQNKYGADMTTRTGDSTYGFNSTADVTNAAMKFNTGEMATIFTIWDAGGKDTLDLSSYHTDSVIDLRAGGYSSAGGWGAYSATQVEIDPTLALINANNTAAGFGARSGNLYNIYFNGVTGVNEGISWKQITGTGEDYLMEQNIGIAYGVVIENGKGGFGDDRINGNQANNELWGNAGDDLLIGLGGNDILHGGAGNDTFAFLSAEIGDLITDYNVGDKIDLSALYEGAMSFIGGDAFTALGQVNYVNGVLSANLAEGAAAEFSVTFTGMPTLTADALVLI